MSELTADGNEALVVALHVAANRADEVRLVVEFLRAKAERCGTGTAHDAAMRRALYDAANDVRQLAHRQKGAGL